MSNPSLKWGDYIELNNRCIFTQGGIFDNCALIIPNMCIKKLLVEKTQIRYNTVNYNFMKMNNKKYFWSISFLCLILLGIAGYWVYRAYSITCCEPGPEQLAFDLQSNPNQILTGNWTYYAKDTEGYSSGINLDLTQLGETVAGEFTMVWSFPKAPAARINNGTLQGKMIGGDRKQATVEWIGSRDDSGSAEIIYNETKDTIEWRTAKSTVSDLSLPESIILYRNLWTQLSADDQQNISTQAKTALEQIPGMEKSELFLEDVTVVGDKAAVPFSAIDGETDGILYLQNKNGVWQVIPDPESGSITTQD